MDVFAHTDQVVSDYGGYAGGSFAMRDQRISRSIASEVNHGAKWADPPLQ